MKKLTISSLTLLASALGLCAQTLSNYQATVAGQNPNYYFTFDGGSLSSSSKGTNANVITLLSSPDPFNFGSDIFRNPSNTVYFSADNDTLVDMGLASDGLISTGGNGVASTNSTASGSVMLLFRSLSPGLLTAQKYIFSAGYTASNHNMLALNFESTNAALGDPQSLKVRFGDQQETILQASNVVPDTWYYFAFTYTESTNGAFLDETGTNLLTVKGKWYLGIPGGTLSSGLITNAIDAVAGENTSLYLGIRDGASGDFRNPGKGAVDEFATWTRRLSDAEITNQFSKLPPIGATNLAYAEVVSAQFPTYFFQLNNSLADSVNPSLTLTTNADTGTFSNDILGYPNACYLFVQTNDALIVTNDLINGGGSGTNDTAAGTGTLSLLFRMLSDTNNPGRRGILCQGQVATTNGNRLELYLESSTAGTVANRNCLRLGLGNTSYNLLTPNQLLPNAWYYFAMRWDETRTSSTDPEVYYYLAPVGVGSNLVTTNYLNPANNSVVGDNGPIYFGNENGLANAFRFPGQGAIDNIAIWNVELSDNEILAQFNAVTNGPAYNPVVPALAITWSLPNVVVSWPASTDAGYALESTTNLVSAWSPAGAPTAVGTNNVVTNAATGGAQYYRLKK